MIPLLTVSIRYDDESEVEIVKDPVVDVVEGLVKPPKTKVTATPIVVYAAELNPP